jgi:hypothetical protein
MPNLSVCSPWHSTSGRLGLPRQPIHASLERETKLNTVISEKEKETQHEYPE